MKTIIAMTTAALLTFAAAGQAAAQTSADAPKTTVSYADLDLSRASGRAVLEQRIQGAIARVCPTRPLPAELDKMKAYRACREAAWWGAKQQLAQIYGGRQLAEAAVGVRGAGR